ncbi:hypothetical protein Maes01_02689 [Microbulbifer aestuariivivens]|uniref:Lipoprotein n=1 Tax=Microbulbifer aestuariivivens TaxID=1908308 RepID=A0ABP9WSN3_9GAMM
MKIRSLILVLIVYLSGCATTVKNINLDNLNDPGSKDGLVLMSAGRMNSKGLLSPPFPFVNYRVFKVGDNGKIEREQKKFIMGEPWDALYRPFGHVGGSRYVFVHFFPLEEGQYVLWAEERGSYGAIIPTGTGAMFMPGSAPKDTGNVFIFNVQKNSINYIGEILTVDYNVQSLDGFAVNDELERDFKFLLKEESDSKNIEVKKELASKGYLIRNRN